VRDRLRCRPAFGPIASRELWSINYVPNDLVDNFGRGADEFLKFSLDKSCLMSVAPLGLDSFPVCAGLNHVARAPLDFGGSVILITEVLRRIVHHSWSAVATRNK
jgi:hypothetical protein